MNDLPRRNWRSGAFWVCLTTSMLVVGLAFGQVPESTLTALEAEASAAQQSIGLSAGGAKGMDVMSLLIKGGVFMIPIGVISLVVVTFVVDRLIGLRSNRLFPSRFRKSIQQFSKQLEPDPRMVYQSCLEHPSAAANVLRSVLLKLGRPVHEIHTAMAESMQREADRAYGNVRWINLSAGIAPLLGLLGTVWGLIRAFHDTTQLTTGQNRADFLAQGIYEALVTTLAGLMVAIPAAIASHFFEGRITKNFSRIEESMEELIPRFERYEGNTRFEVIGRELAPREIGHTKPSKPSVPR